MTPADLPDLNQEDWRQCEDFLFGIDLFNEEYWWECHEVLEGLWHAAGVDSEAGHVLQAVIQCAAAHLKVETKQPSGARRLFDHSLRHARWSGSRKLGLDLESLIRDTRSYLSVEEIGPARLVLDFS
jgi:predicted metal-dependent hydrolase